FMCRRSVMLVISAVSSTSPAAPTRHKAATAAALEELFMAPRATRVEDEPRPRGERRPEVRRHDDDRRPGMRLKRPQQRMRPEEADQRDRPSDDRRTIAR